MMDLFAPVPADLKRHRLREYRAYLIERDGEMDFATRTLAKREATMAGFEAPAAAPRALDVAGFKRGYRAFDRRDPPSDEVALLLALVKSNAAESYGVSCSLQRASARALQNQDDTELRVLCQETYHTRLLLSAANLYGIDVSEPYTPPSALRVLIGGIAHLPMAVSQPLVLASEILGTIMFTKLIAVAQRVLKDAPEVRDAVEARLIEICTDERGHVSYNRLTMTPATLAETRLLLPIIARGLANALPEAAFLGVYPRNILQDLPLIADSKRLPEAVRKQAFVA